MSVTLCIFAFLATLYLSRRSLAWGIVSALAFGYFYGILRANLNEMMSHFIFDAALIGLYVGRVVAVRSQEARQIAKRIQPWLIVLFIWPALMTVLPTRRPWPLWGMAPSERFASLRVSDAQPVG